MGVAAAVVISSGEQVGADARGHLCCFVGCLCEESCNRDILKQRKQTNCPQITF